MKHGGCFLLVTKGINHKNSSRWKQLDLKMEKAIEMGMGGAGIWMEAHLRIAIFGYVVSSSDGNTETCEANAGLGLLPEDSRPMFLWD